MKRIKEIFRYLFTSGCRLPDSAWCDCPEHRNMMVAEVEQYLRAF